MTIKIGVEPAELDIEVLAGADDLVGTFAFAEAVRIGLFDGATVELDRLFAPPQATGAGRARHQPRRLLWFYGRVAEADVGRSKIAIKVKSLMNLLAMQQMPRRLYQRELHPCLRRRDVRLRPRHRQERRRRHDRRPGADHDRRRRRAQTQGLIDAGTAISTDYVEGTVTGATGANTGYTPHRSPTTATARRSASSRRFSFRSRSATPSPCCPAATIPTGAGGCAGLQQSAALRRLSLHPAAGAPRV